MLPQLPGGFTAVVTGASGGIGSAIIDALLTSDRPGHIIAISRERIHYVDSCCSWPCHQPRER